MQVGTPAPTFARYPGDTYDRVACAATNTPHTGAKKEGLNGGSYISV